MGKWRAEHKGVVRIGEGLHLHHFVVPLLLLPSLIWDIIDYLSFVLGKIFRRSGSHSDRVGKVQEQVRRWRVEGNGRKMCTARPSWKSVTPVKVGYKDKMYRVAVNLDRVLEVNPDEMTCTVEPAVTIGFLNRLLVSKGFTLPIVPELDFLTIGGLVMGAGLESTSHKYGLWGEICLEYESVTADGECIKANADTNPDLFMAIPISYGTLGFLTAVKIRMIKYKPFIRLTYRPTYSLDETVQVLHHQTHKEVANDSVEGIMYNENQAVIMTGEFVEQEEVEPNKINRMGLWFKPWFYRHVQTFIKKGETVEYVPTLQFHQRHNKGCFWLSAIWLPWAHNTLARFLIGWILPFNSGFLKYLTDMFLPEDHEDDVVIQDYILPINHLKAAIQLSAKIADVWPLWMVPVRASEVLQRLWPEKYDKVGNVMYVDLGIYGPSNLKDYKGRDATMRTFEKFTLAHDGAQGLYADTLLTEDEFKQMFNGDHYQKVRESLPLCTQAFPTIYQKVSRRGRKGQLV